MTVVTEDAVRRAVGAVVDPELRRPIAELGMVRDISVADGLAATARVITAAAAIMVAVFGAFVLSDQVFLKLIGLGMAAAIFLDATVVRMVLVPASMQLLGERNWWLPRWLDRVLPNLDVDGPPPLATPADDDDPAAEPVAA